MTFLMKHNVNLGTKAFPNVRNAQTLALNDLEPATDYDIGVSGVPQVCKYIRIYNNAMGDALSLAEVRAWNTKGENAASPANGAVATQSSISNKGMHTATSKGHHWEVKIRPQVIRSVTIWNRTACCSDRLTGATLAMYDEEDDVFFEHELTAAAKQAVLVPPEGY